jgi:hypothetical protein
VIDGDRVVHEVRYPHPVQAVWHALTEGPNAMFDGGWDAKLTHDLGLVLAGARDPDDSRVEAGLHRHPDLEAPDDGSRG